MATKQRKPAKRKAVSVRAWCLITRGKLAKDSMGGYFVFSDNLTRILYGDQRRRLRRCRVMVE